MRRENIWKAVISGVLVLTLAVTGITLYNTGKEEEQKEKQKNEAQLVEDTNDEKLNEDPFEAQDVSNGSVDAQNFEEDGNEWFEKQVDDYYFYCFSRYFLSRKYY